MAGERVPPGGETWHEPERDVLTSDERQELHDEPMLVHTFDAYRLVRLLLAAPSPEPLPLDVERLARALGTGDPDVSGYRVEARRIAAEYAREPDRPT